MEKRAESFTVNFSKPLVGNLKGRIKFGYRKNGTRWYYGLPSRQARQAEIQTINQTLEMLYPKGNQ